MQQAASARSQAAIDDRSELAVMSLAHVFQHADRDEGITGSGDGTVILFDELALSLQSFGTGAFARIADLFPRNVVGPDHDAIVACHVQRQPAPAATGLHHGLAGLQAQLATDIFQLGLLGVIQAGRGLRKVGAGIHQVRIQPQPVERIADVIVVVDVAARACQCPGLAQRQVQLEPLPPAPAGGVAFEWVEILQQADDIALDVHGTTAVSLAEVQVRPEQQRPQPGAAADDHPGHGRTVTRPEDLAIPQHDLQWRLVEDGQNAPQCGPFQVADPACAGAAYFIQRSHLMPPPKTEYPALPIHSRARARTISLSPCRVPAQA